MAAAQLNFDEATLDRTSGLYDLYSRFYQGMRTANQVDAPDYTTNPPLTPQGAVDEAEIATQLAAYSDILMKNSAYMMANAIMSTVSGGGSGGTAGVGFLSRNGDSMVGKLTALYGFEAGIQNTKIFDVYHNAVSNKNFAQVYGSLVVDEDETITGQLNLGNSGIFFGPTHTIYIDNSNVLVLERDNISLKGAVAVDGTITLGTLVISSTGITKGAYEYYHQGNINLSTVDFVAKDGHFYGNMQIDGTVTADGAASLLYGFQLGEFGKRLLYSVQDDVINEVASVHLNSDLHIDNGGSIKFNGKSIIKVANGTPFVVSFSAPGMVMHLGDSDGNVATTKILLKSDLYNYSGDYRIVSANGDGNFPNSLSAGCGNAGPTVLQTYYTDANNCGVVFQRNIRFGSVTGPALSTNQDTKETLVLTLPYITVDNEVSTTHQIGVTAKYIQTTSLFRDLSKAWSATLQLYTEAEFFRFSKPVEVSSISIVSNQYKTRLIENALMFADAVFLEGVADGILHQGNAYFTGSLSSVRFASGFAGYGWAINESELYGGIAATFDELTVRKKMRVYELEVQKINVTNGSLWVSDACSGDLVEEIL